MAGPIALTARNKNAEPGEDGRPLERLIHHRSHLGTNVAALDGLRGVAVLMVVFSHMSRSGVNLHPALNFAGAGKFGVFLFFVLSAFLLTHQHLVAPPAEGRNARYWAGYTIRRVLRIYPLFSIALVFGTLNAFVGMALFGPREVSIVRHLALLDGFKIFWAIPVEMKFYLFLPFVLIIFDLLLSRRRLLAVGCIFAAITAKEWLLPVSAWGGLSIGLLRYLSIFLYGVMAAIIYSAMRSEDGGRFADAVRDSYAVRLLIDAIAVVTFAAVIVTVPGIYRLVVSPDGPMPVFGLNLAWYGFAWMLCVLAALCAGTATSRILETSPLRWCGMVSFSVYLVHLPVIEWIRRAMWDYPKPGQVAVILLLTLVISTCTYLAIERPFVLLGSRLSRRIYSK